MIEELKSIEEVYIRRTIEELKSIEEVYIRRMIGIAEHLEKAHDTNSILRLVSKIS